MGVQGGEAPGSFRNLNVEFPWKAYRVEIQEVFSKLPENTGITGGFYQNTGQFSQLSKYRRKLPFYRKYRNYRRRARPANKGQSTWFLGLGYLHYNFIKRLSCFFRNSENKVWKWKRN